MKKAIFFTLILTVLIGVSGCVKKESRIGQEIDFVNQDLPQYLGDGMTLELVYDNGDDVVCEISLDEDMYDISDFELYRTEFKSNFKELINSDSDMEEMCRVLKEEKHGLIYKLVGDQTGEAIEIGFSSDEI